MTPDQRASRAVVAVIATYRDRSAMLDAVLERLVVEGVARAIVIDNGSTWAVADRLGERFGNFVEVLPMNGNQGCAVAYAEGMKRARAAGADMVWLLDDDNRPTLGSLSALRAAWETAVIDTPADRLIVSAVRDEHHVDVMAGVPERHLKVRVDSFGGFHWRDLPYKLWRRTRWGRPSLTPPPVVRVDVTPYGGALFDVALLERFGLPLADFYQYGDDQEWTWRVTRAGGRILIVTAAQIEDLEISWNPTAQMANRFRGLAAGSSAFRTYYATRNAAYFESRFRRRNRLSFAVNRLIYLGMVRHYARASGHPERWRLIREAVADGMAGRLNVNPRYRLN